MNKVIMAGRLTDKVELKELENNLIVGNFTIAIDNGKDKNGNDKQATFISCVAFRETATRIEEWFKKGDGINIEGRLTNRSYTDKDGNRHSFTDVIVEKWEFPLTMPSRAKGETKSKAKNKSEEEYLELF